MRANVGIWWITATFFYVVGTIYIAWNIIFYSEQPWPEAIEWVGAVALIFTGLMASLIAFYIQRVHKAQGGELPADVLTADIDDGDPEVGEFSPWSWWPIVLASSAGIALIGLATGAWLFPIGIAIFLIAIVGWVFEYYRGYFAR